MAKFILVGIATFLAGVIIAAAYFATRASRVDAPAALMPLAASPSSLADGSAAPANRSRDAGSPGAAAAQPTKLLRLEALYALAAGSTVEELRLLLAQAQEIATADDRNDAVHILFARFGELDLRTALEFLESSGLEPAQDLLRTIFRFGARVDVDAAIEALEELNRDARQIANDAILVAWSDSDALTSVRDRLPPVDGMTPYSPDAVMGIVEEDPARAAAEALLLDAAVRARAIAEVGGRWAVFDGEAAFAFRDRIGDPGLREWFVRGVMRGWGGQDPERVVALLDSGISREEQELIINNGLARIAMDDAEMALTLALRIADPPARDAAFRLIVAQWAPQNPTAVSQAVELIDDAQARERLARALVPYLAAESPQRALEWAQAMDGGRGELWRSALLAVADEDPQRAISIAGDAETAAERSNALRSVIVQIANRDLDAAMQYWPQLPADASEAAAFEIAQLWAVRDPVAAERWLLSLPQAAARDSGLGALAASSLDDPFAAARILNAMRSDTRRTDAAANAVAGLLRGGDSGGAQTLAELLVLPPEGRLRIRAMLAEQPR